MGQNRSDRIKGRPPVVHDAVVNGDVASLSYFGKKGAEVLKKKRADNAEADIYFRQQEIARSDAEATRRADENREHIVPLDADDSKEAA